MWEATVGENANLFVVSVSDLMAFCVSFDAVMR